MTRSPITLTEEQQKTLQGFASAFLTMRKYQTAFFKGDKSALKNAKFWEQEADNKYRNLAKDLLLEPPLAKREPNQGGLF